MRTLLFFIAILFCTPTFSQFDESAKKLLVFKHHKGNKTKYIASDTKLVYRLKKDGIKRKTESYQLKTNSIVIDGTEYQLDEFEQFSGRSAGVKAANVLGGTMIVLGTGVSFLGYAMIMQVQNTNNCGEVLILAFGGAIIGIAGVVVVLVGIIPLLLRNKRFDLTNGKWAVEIGTEVKKTSQ